MNLSTLLVLVFLVGMWVALLVGPALFRRGSGGSRRGDSIRSFQHQLSALEHNRMRTGRPRSLAGSATLRRLPDPRMQARRKPLRGRAAAARRKHIVSGLSAVAFSCLVLSFVASAVFFWGFVSAAALLIGYLGLMFHLLGSQAEREMKVAFLPHANPGAEPTALLQLREASAGRG